MSQYWSSLVTELSPYVPGEQRTGQRVVKLNTNENPYPPSQQVMQAISDVDGAQLRRYPEPASNNLRKALGSYHNLTTEQVFVGNGSDEVLALAFMAFFTNEQPLVFPEVTYSFYPVYCQLYKIPFIELPMAADFSIDWSDMPEELGGVVFPNPNAPTGLACTPTDIENLLNTHSNKVVLVDEAYIDFGAQSATALIDQYPNLLVTQTFSKMRIGAAYGHKDLIAGLDRVKNSFNSYPLDVVAEAAALASLKDESYHREHVDHIIANRHWLTKQLEARKFNVLPSAANFIFAAPQHTSAKQLHEYLNSRDILVRYWDKPKLQDWLRISIGSTEELQQLVTAIDQMPGASGDSAL